MESKLFQIDLPYLTTPYLLNLFKDYKAPRDKIKNAVKNGDLINIKQGLYILGPDYGRAYSMEVLSGMIYGPSAVSLEYALSYHGFIPERVEAVSCICFKRDKSFQTPVGRFTYKYLPESKYAIGIEYRQTDLGNYFIAGPEKAISDKVYFSGVMKQEEITGYLLEELRIDLQMVMTLDLNLLTRLSAVYKRNIPDLLQAIAEIQERSRG